jgi:hypothetical protein
MRKTSDDTIAEARRLRIDERKSSREISRILDVPIGTLSPYLSDIPLTKEEKREIMSDSGLKSNQRRWLGHQEARDSDHPDHDAVSHGLLSPIQRGALSELAVRSEIIRRGFVPLIPDIPGLRYDMVIHDPENNLYSRVQVKSARWPKSGLPVFNLTVNSNGSRREYCQNDFDCLIVYNHKKRVFYIKTQSELSSKMTGRPVSNLSVSVYKSDEDNWDKLFR